MRRKDTPFIVFFMTIALTAFAPTANAKPPMEPPAAGGGYRSSLPPPHPVEPAAKKLEAQIGLPGPLAGKEKSDTETMNSSLDQVGGFVAEVSYRMEQKTPKVWRIMIRQQYARAAGMLATPLGILVAILIFTAILGKVWVLGPNVHDDARVAKMFFAQIMPCFVSLAMTIWCMTALSRALTYLLNPEFYAIRDLIKMILDPVDK